MWVAVVGSRDFGECDCRPHFPPRNEEEREHQKVCPKMRAWKLLLYAMTRATMLEGFEGFVSGGASGADSMAEEMARDLLHAPIKVYRPLAGPEPFAVRAHQRNQRIVDHSDMVLAFFSPGPRSPGTSDTVGRALKKGIKVHVWHEGKWSES